MTQKRSRRRNRRSIYFPLVSPLLAIGAMAFALTTIELTPVDIEYPDTIAVEVTQ